MAPYRAALMGCGRIGAGFNWPAAPYVYDHCSTYKMLAHRVSLAWVFDPDGDRVRIAGQKFDVLAVGGEPWRLVLQDMLERDPVDVVSICTQPEDRWGLLSVLAQYPSIKGAWIEKPLAVSDWPKPWKINVGYIRRFDPRHMALCGRVRELWVWARKDEATVCHFTDLARFWGVPREGLHYFAMNGPASYVAVLDTGTAEFFPLGGLAPGSAFMVNALGNLLDALEGKVDLVSPPESAVVSEAWAAEILADHAVGDSPAS